MLIPTPNSAPITSGSTTWSCMDAWPAPVGYADHEVVLAGHDRSFPHVEVAGREPGFSASAAAAPRTMASRVEDSGFPGPLLGVVRGGPLFGNGPDVAACQE